MTDHRGEAARLGGGSIGRDVATTLAAHASVPRTVDAASADIAAAIEALVAAMAVGGRLVYLGAGTSGWLAALDAAEAIVTFGMRGRIESVVGGGLLLGPTAMGVGDDDVDAALADPVLAGLTPADVVVAVSASGRTPFTCAGADLARDRGSRLVAIVSDVGTPLGAAADIEICVPVDGEVIGGSSRLAAGLGQKLVLNTLSTVVMVRLGRTVDGHMVCVEPLNDKLRVRAESTLAAVTGAPVEQVRELLAEANGAGDVVAVALLGATDVERARARLTACHGDIARAVAAT